MTNKPERSVEEILFWCSRCGQKYQPLGKVLKWGKHYPAFTVKKADGTIEEHQANTEIKEALCRDCAKEYYDNEKIQTLQAERQKREEMVEAERERVLNKLSDQSLHSEVIFEVLGPGHHYSTMPVVAGIVSRIKEKFTQPNNTK